MATALLGKLAPRQPVWRTFIAHRKIQRLLGVLAVKRWRFHLERVTGEAGADPPRLPPVR
jgi:hypothetical protein